MFTIISFFQELMKGGVGIKAGGCKISQKLIRGGETIIRYSRVRNFTANLEIRTHHRFALFVVMIVMMYILMMMERHCSCATRELWRSRPLLQMEMGRPKH